MSLKPGKYNISIERGASWSFAAEVSTKDGDVTTPFNFTNYDIYAVIVDKKSQGAPTIEASLGYGIEVVNNKIYLTFTAEQTAILTAGLYEWQLDITAPGEDPQRLFRGIATVSGWAA